MEEGLAFKGARARISPKVVWQTWARSCVLEGRSCAPPRSAAGWASRPAARRRPRSWATAWRSASRRTRSSSARARSRAWWRRRRPRRRRHLGAAADADAGHPGSPTAAVLLGGLLIWGLQPGPMLFVEQKDFVWGLIASMYLGNLVGLIVVLTTVPWWAALLRIPFSVIAPVIIVICAIGAYTVHSSMFDVVLMLVFGVLGYLFRSSSTRWRRWCWRWCWATWPRPASARRCCSRRAAWPSSGRTLWWAASRRWRWRCCCGRWGFAVKSLRRREYSPRREEPSMKIAVVGAGAIGGYLGRLAIAGGRHLHRAQSQPGGDQRARLPPHRGDGSEQHAPTARPRSMADAGPQDAVLLTLKAHQVRDVLPGLRELFGPQTMVVTMINGIPGGISTSSPAVRGPAPRQRRPRRRDRCAHRARGASSAAWSIRPANWSSPASSR